jgi:UDP-N-acetylglucosamine transferase subunit ALG13
MIFVTTGSGPLDFSRLVKTMDEIAGQLGEEVVIQAGFTDYRPKNAVCFDFVTYKEMREYFRKAEVIIGHASAGPIMHAREFRKPLIIFPRSGRLNELIDGHQVDTAREIEGKIKFAQVVYDADGLLPAVKKALEKSRSVCDDDEYAGSESLQALIGYIRDYLSSLERGQ